MSSTSDPLLLRSCQSATLSPTKATSGVLAASSGGPHLSPWPPHIPCSGGQSSFYPMVQIKTQKGGSLPSVGHTARRQNGMSRLLNRVTLRP